MKTFQNYISTVRRHNSHKWKLYSQVKLIKLIKFFSMKEREHRLPPDINCIASTYN